MQNHIRSLHLQYPVHLASELSKENSTRFTKAK